MIKLTQLLEKENDLVSFKTTQVDADPETGKVTWDVDYSANFAEIVKKLDELISDFQKAKKITKIDDPVVMKVMDAIRSSKISLVRRLNQKYPELLPKER